MNLFHCFVLTGLLASSAWVMPASTLPADYTTAQTYLFDSLGSVTCFDVAPSSSACSAFDAIAGALVTDGRGGSASVRLGESGGSGYALTAYSFGLFGAKTENVPIIINGFADIFDGYAFDSLAYASYVTYEYTDSTIKLVDNYIGNAAGCAYVSTIRNAPCQASGNFTLNASVESNSQFIVAFQAVAMGANASAFIDPKITVDPAFADAGLFTLVSSPGVFATPEPICGPAVAILLIVGAAFRWGREGWRCLANNR